MRLMAESKNHEVAVSAQTQYLPDQSDESASRYVFAYTITIRNAGSVAAQLISRHWIITTADGETEEVQGAGVVGEQPVLSPGEQFEYTSFCPLKTNVGTMHGSYTMVTPSGEVFQARIAPFTLAVPHALN